MPERSHALALAQAGWAVLPLHGKVPITAHGVLDAATDADTIERWWPDGAQHNIGARVPANAIVLDIDPQNGGTVEALAHAARTSLPRTLTVHSGRGTGGRHLYFLHPGGDLTSRRLPSGIDLKTSRGYCVMPPSVHPATGAPYRWEHSALAALPAALSALLQRERPRPMAPRRRTEGEHSERAVHLARHVEALAEGNRNAGLYWAACRAVEDGHPDSTFELLEGAALAAGLDEIEAQRTIASARRGGAR